MKLCGENPASMRSTVPDIHCAKDLEYVAARWHSFFSTPNKCTRPIDNVGLIPLSLFIGSCAGPLGYIYS